jgi:uncharacterized beta-barrel protein YwiB (DUF1934 family)
VRDITLQVKSIQKVMGEEPVVIEFKTEGKLYEKSNALYLVYEETELSGFPNHKTSLKIQRQTVTMKRFGESEATMHFEKGIRESSDYQTPHGVFKLETLTHGVTVDLQQTKGRVEIVYALSIQHMHEATHTLIISYW